MPGSNEFTGREPMTCEEFALAWLDLRSASEGSPLRQAVAEHVRQCPQCAMLQENLRTLEGDLRYLGLETKETETPVRVEMRLMQEFRARHKTAKTRRLALVSVWSLAAAAVVVAAVSWTTWRHERGLSAFGIDTRPPRVAPTNANESSSSPAQADGLVVGDTLVASSTSGDFTLLPGSTPSPMEDATVVRVQMQRGALGALGFSVNEEHAADLIQVDLLVGDDGLPQAVRLPESASTE
jgi:hypothetical protein